MKIGDMVPLQEPQKTRATSSDGEDSVQSVPSRLSEGQLEAITESPADPSTKSSQLLDNLAPDRLEPHKPDNLFEDLVKIDVFSNVPGNVDVDYDLANLTRNPANPTEKKVDRHYLGGTVTGAGGDALKNALGATGADALKDAMNLTPTGSQTSTEANVPHFGTGGAVTDSGGSSGGSSTTLAEESKGSGTGSQGGPTVYGGNTMVGGRDMSLVGQTTHNADGSSQTTSNYGRGGTKTDYYDKEGTRTKMTIETADGTKQTSLYEGGNIKERVTTKDGETTKTVYSADGKEKTTKTDKNGKEIKYDTGEGGNVFYAPTAEEFLRIKNFGGGYTDGRPELQSNTQIGERDPAKEDPNFGVIDGDPDYIEATLDRPNLGNKVQPDTRPDLQGPKPEMPPAPGVNPHSNDPD